MLSSDGTCGPQWPPQVWKQSGAGPSEGKWEQGWAVGLKGQDSLGGVLQVSLMQQNVFGHPFGAFIQEEQ